MWFQALACDYDGTLATDGAIAPATMESLQRVRGSGRRIVLVTGRRFDDLLEVCRFIGSFDLVVAENGAVLFDPATQRVEDLAAAPPPEFLDALRGAQVPFVTGRIIVATVVPYEGVVLETIRRSGLDLQIIFNKEAVMVLPSGVSKASGLDCALARLGISWNHTIGMGDAENDHGFLARVGFSVAVANAIPALAVEADLVTTMPNGAGVREVLEGPLTFGLEALARRARR